MAALHARSPRGPADLSREVWKQFWGSDSESGYTFIYVWLANQFGHFMIGFAGALFCVWVVSFWYPSVLHPQTSEEVLVVGGIAGGWFLFWILKELLVDLAGALQHLRVAESARSDRLAGKESNSQVRTVWEVLHEYGKDLRDVWVVLTMRPPDKAAGDLVSETENWFRYDILRDSLMDIWFYFSGITTALMMLCGPALATKLDEDWLAGILPFATFLFLLVVSCVTSTKWLWSNIAFDKAQLPAVARFALIALPLTKETRECALKFALRRRKDQPGHLVIIGPPKSGRTTTAVGLAVEALLRLDRDNVVYTTFCKLLDGIAAPQNLRPGFFEKRPVWRPVEAELLIVDDVGAETANNGHLLTADQFQAELQQNRRFFVEVQPKLVIWVVGDDPVRGPHWKYALEKQFHFSVDVVTTVPVGEQEVDNIAHQVEHGQTARKTASRRPGATKPA